MPDGEAGTPPLSTGEGHTDRPTFLRVLRMMYWSAAGDLKRLPHLIGILLGFSRNWTRLWLRRRFVDRRPPVAIALMDRLGDIVSVEPVARYARERFPDAPILWFTSVPYAEVVAAYPTVDRVVVVRCLTEWMLLRSTGVFQAVLDLHFNGTYCLDCVISVAKGGAAAQITGDRHYHFGNQLATRCLCAGISPIAQGPRLMPAAKASNKVDTLNLPAAYVVIHCAASERPREWTDANWSSLTDFVAGQLGMNVVEIGLSPRAIQEDGPRRRNLCGQLSVMETAEVIRRARMFVGIDSGPAHLANAVGTPGVVLLGHFRDHERYMPYSGGYETGALCDLLWADGPVASLSLASVVAAVERRLAAPNPAAAEVEPAIDVPDV